MDYIKSFFTKKQNDASTDPTRRVNEDVQSGSIKTTRESGGVKERSMHDIIHEMQVNRMYRAALQKMPAKDSNKQERPYMPKITMTDDEESDEEPIKIKKRPAK